MGLRAFGLGLAAVAAGAAVALPAAAGAAPVTLWGCHGPAGQALGTAPFTATASGDGTADLVGGGCADALGDGGLRAAFTRPDPATGSAAGWRAELPAGVAVSEVRLVRRTSGFGGAPVLGGGQRYAAATAGGVLESGSVEDGTNAALDGAVAFPAPGGGFVSAGVSCAAADRCAAPSATPLGVQVDALAVTMDDADAPRGAVGGIVTPASGTVTLSVRATDAGIGLARAEATVDGVVVAAAPLGGAGCTDLSPGDAAVDLPLGGGCPAAVTDLQLPIPTPTITDGAHRLRVTVTDAAGNAAVLTDQDFPINNTPPERQSTAMLTLGTAGTTPAGGSGAAGAGAAGGGGAVSGAGGSATGGGSAACASPRLSVFLKDKPLRVTRGVPVLRRNGRYRFTGTLTCAVRGRRVRAPSGIGVSLYSTLGGRTFRKSGVATRAGGALTAILAYPSARIVEFRYMSARVRIRIAVATVTKKGRAR
ncbi:hypothetical protein [Conexibacter woesei]|uniref:hypothetical protein n=1 Tax=Conexibacter woesei TaxID=191495 RepID=UPI0003FFF8A0|nr:hypothetical protein [Conexibacter woesei]